MNRQPQQRLEASRASLEASPFSVKADTLSLRAEARFYLTDSGPFGWAARREGTRL